MVSPPDLLDPQLGAALVEAAGEPHFGARLLAAAQQFDRVTEVFGYHLTPHGRPRPLVSCSELPDAERRTSEYVARFYRNDPALWARRKGPDGGFVERVHCRDIALRDYRAICFERPRFADKLCYGWRRGQEELVLSFYRERGGDLCEPAGIGALANVALAALARSARALRPAQENVSDTVGRLDDLLLLHFPLLSRRERQVCARTLAGRTAARIGQDLGLSLGTVLTYRQRAYAKLGVSSPNELLPALLR